MTTPEPVSPKSPVRTSSDTTDGSTLAAMSATDPGSRLTAGATGDSSKAGSVTAAGSRLAANTPIAAPNAPITSAATSTPMTADGRSRRSNSACRKVNRSAGSGSARSLAGVSMAGGPSRAPAVGIAPRIARRLGLVGRQLRAPAAGRGCRRRRPGRPKASCRNSGCGGSPSSDRRRPAGGDRRTRATPPGRPKAPACSGSTRGFERADRGASVGRAGRPAGVDAGRRHRSDRRRPAR